MSKKRDKQLQRQRSKAKKRENRLKREKRQLAKQAKRKQRPPKPRSTQTLNVQTTFSRSAWLPLGNAHQAELAGRVLGRTATPKTGFDKEAWQPDPDTVDRPSVITPDMATRPPVTMPNGFNAESWKPHDR